MEIYACKEVDYKRVRQKRAKTASRQAKGRRGHPMGRPSLPAYTNTNLKLNNLDEIEEFIQPNRECFKWLPDLVDALVAIFKCTICLNVKPPNGIKFAGCCIHLVVSVEWADEWFQSSSLRAHCHNVDGRSIGKRLRCFKSLVKGLLQPPALSPKRKNLVNSSSKSMTLSFSMLTSALFIG